MVRFVSYLELKRVLVNVHSEDDVHHKLLQYAENCLLHVDLRGAVLAHPDLIKPFLLGLDRVVFEEVEHDDQFVFEEGMIYRNLIILILEDLVKYLFLFCHNE